MITMKSVPESELKIEFKGFFTFKDAVYVNSCNSKLVMANAGFGVYMAPIICTGIQLGIRQSAIPEIGPAI